MGSSPAELGGTSGAQEPPSPSDILGMLSEIEDRTALSWIDGEAPYEPDIERGDFSRGTIRQMTLQAFSAAVKRAVAEYRSAPPPPPSRVSRDFVAPAAKAASRLSAALENEHAKAVLSHLFSDYQQAEAFLGDLRRLSEVQEVDQEAHNRRRVEDIAGEFGIDLQDPREYILANYGVEALADFDRVEARMAELDNKHRIDPIRFRLAVDTVSAFVNGYGLWQSIAEGKGIKRQALAEIVTLAIAIVGAHDGAPKPSEDYFAKSITNEAIEYVTAEYWRGEVGSKYDI